MATATIDIIPKVLNVFLYTTFHAIAALVDIFIDATIWLASGLTERVEWLCNYNNRRVIGELINVYLDTSFRLDPGLAIVTWINSNPGFHHLDKTKIVPLSNLHSFVCNSSNENCIVFVRGLVRSKSPSAAVLVSSHDSKEQAKGVALQKTETCKGIQGLMSGLRPKSLLERVPFILALQEDCYMNVNLDDSSHPIPLTTVYHQAQRITYKFLGREYQVDKIIEEKLLPVDQEITAVRKICISEDDTLEITACEDLPYFLSDQTRTETANLWLQKLARICVGMLLVLTSLQLLRFAFPKILWHVHIKKNLAHCIAIVFGLVISVNLLKHSNIWMRLWRNYTARIQRWWQYLKKLPWQVRSYVADKARMWQSHCMEWGMQARNYIIAKEEMWRTYSKEWATRARNQVQEQWTSCKRWATQTRDYVIAEVQKWWAIEKEWTRQFTNNVIALLQRWLREWHVDQHPRNVTRVHVGNAPRAFGGQREVGTHEGIPEELLCVICLENRKAIAFFPCGHVVCCATCAPSIRQRLCPMCPVCRLFISYSAPVYL